ncbi:hypothetical protein E4U13_001218 [Claviceps humidiphila]|uniref:2EXR domain-containing protein n=1 Tax=Claviceps humidiphila TaxID=1294629 RepID=A0A9P7Q411_9HYPO|nr:hypothetical protein E4U13_001218 [Claviceps humidiphila]
MFLLFSKLAPELRHHIWRLSLPDDIGQPLHFFQEYGYNRVREIEAHEPIFRYGYRELEIEFRTEWIDPAVQLRLPQFFVNHEAHDITAAWLRQQGGGFVLSPGQAHEMGRFVSPFNTERDTLYITHDRWWEFSIRPFGDDPDPYEDEPSVAIVNKGIRFALPEAIFWDAVLLECLPAFKRMDLDDPAKFFVIMGVQPERMCLPADNDSWFWWEMEGTEMGAIVWDMTKQEFVFKQDSEALDEEHMALFARMEEAVRLGLHDTMIQYESVALEIRLAYAVRRQWP